MEAINTFVDGLNIDATLKAALKADLLKKPELLNKFKSGEYSLDVWEALGSRVTQRIDEGILANATKLLKNNNLGLDKAGLKALSDNHLKFGAACGKCVQPFEKLVENLDNLQQYMDLPGAQQLLNEIKSNAQKKFQGADWVLQVLKDKKFNGTVKAFEFKFDPELGNKADIITTVPSKGDIKIDGKNWGGWNPSYSQHFTSQLAVYLKNSTDIDQVLCFFNKAHYKGDLKKDLIAAITLHKAEFKGIPWQKAQQIIGGNSLLNASPDTVADALVDYLSKNTIFDKVFKLE